jgi:hypothetical protein
VNRQECQKLIDSYVGWLRQGLSVEELGEACELTTPFLDRHNDYLQVYATRHNGTIILSDDGYILSDLRTSGLDVDTPKRKMVLDSVLKGLVCAQKTINSWLRRPSTTWAKDCIP